MIAVSVSGAESVARGLGTLAARLADLSPGFRELGARMVAVARPITPFLTGALAASLTARAEPQGVRMGSGLIYAGVQERRFGFLARTAAETERTGATEVESLIESTARRAGLI